MKVEETTFLNDYIAMADYGDKLGWHERNGGNFTYWMKPKDVADVKDELHEDGKWLLIGTTVDNLANEYFLISGTGKYFHNMKKDPHNTIGIIQVDSTGTKYRICWGLEHGGRPTSCLLYTSETHRPKKPHGSLNQSSDFRFAADSLSSVLPVSAVHSWRL